MVFSKKGNYIYRKDKKALAVGVVNGNTAVIPEGIEELNQDSVLIGQNISKVTLPSSLKCLRGAWLDMGNMDDCVFEFKSTNPPKLLRQRILQWCLLGRRFMFQGSQLNCIRNG